MQKDEPELFIGVFDPPGYFAPLEELWRFLAEEAQHYPQGDPMIQRAIRRASEELKRRSN